MHVSASALHCPLPPAIDTPTPPVVPQAVAQGRVWTGQRAIERKLVDVLGGVHEAVALVKQAAGIEQSEKVTLVEVSRGRTSPLALLGEFSVVLVRVVVVVLVG